MRDIKGKNVIITGASAGLGRAIAVAFAKAGANVGLIARSEEALKDVVVGAAIAVADMANYDEVKAAALKLNSELGGIDVWVNNAMETIFSRVENITAEEFKRVTEVNYLGYVYGTQETLKLGCKHVIQIGSALSYRSIPLQSAYCASKAAIRGFTDSLRSELIHDKSKVDLTIVHMPALNTTQFSWARTHIPHQPKPVGTIFQPELGAEAVVHAARYPRREYWVGGSTVAAIIGNKFLPGYMDRKMAKMCYEQQWVKDSDLPVREGNLLETADKEMHKAHGLFDGEAKTKSFSWSVMKFLSRLL